jgi:hypothetical protein
MEIEQQESNGQKQKAIITNKSSHPKRYTLLMILGVTVMMQAMNGMFAGLEREPLGGVTLFGYLMLFGLMGYWLDKDSRQHRISWVFDMGFFLYLAWPVIVPIYLFRTRRFKAIPIILGFLGIYIGAYAIGGVIGIIIRPEGGTGALVR